MDCNRILVAVPGKAGQHLRESQLGLIQSPTFFFPPVVILCESKISYKKVSSDEEGNVK